MRFWPEITEIVPVEKQFGEILSNRPNVEALKEASLPAVQRFNISTNFR
jgi:hypothetical protein